MTTLLLTHEACLAHDPGPHHPELPARLKAVLAALAKPAFAKLARREAPRASLEQIALIHPGDFVQRLLAVVPKQGYAAIDADTVLSPGSGEAALRAAGACIAAVDAVMKGEAQNAFCAVRPPGHHAEIGKPMGFCFFDNAAIAARHAQRKYGISRAAVIDFDVHHGNGTQDIFWADKSVMYCSTHQMPLFPGTGARGERGEHDTIVNAPLAPEDGSAQFRSAFENTILPQLRKFAPELLIISAGFDAHHRDPLASINLKGEDFGWVTKKLMDIAEQSAGGRVVSMLEGGYDLQGLKESVAAHVTALMGTTPKP